MEGEMRALEAIRGIFTKLASSFMAQRRLSLFNFEPVSEEDQVVVLGVGAAGGVQLELRPELERIHLIMVEPSQNEVAKLEALAKSYPSASVLHAALSDREGKQPCF
jgi:hypothetical protein